MKACNGLLSIAAAALALVLAATRAEARGALDGIYAALRKVEAIVAERAA